MTSELIETTNKPLTLESMMSAFNTRMTKYEELWDKRDAEWDKRNAEWDKRSAEWDKENAKRRKEIENVWKQIAATDKQIAATDKQIGGMGNSNGDFAQEFFFNALYHGDRKLFGQQFYDVMPEVRRYSKKGGLKSEYDVMLLNGQSICIIEVKYKADTDDVNKALKIEPSFRANFPEYANKTLYLALASMSFDKRVKKACQEAGVAMIKQVGDTIEVYDEHLKSF